YGVRVPTPNDTSLASGARFGRASQPPSALFTAATSSAILTASSPFGSTSGHRSTGIVPRAMLTPMTSSSIPTLSSWLQSPAQVTCARAPLPTQSTNAATKNTDRFMDSSDQSVQRRDAEGTETA